MIVFAIILPMTIAQITDVEKLAKENEELRHFLLERAQKINYLEEQLAWLKRQIFGKRSEKIVSDLRVRKEITAHFGNAKAPAIGRS